MPCFNDSGGPAMPGHCGIGDVAFPLHVQGRRPRKVISELSTQPTISLSTLHPFGYPRGARLASGWRPPLAGRDSYPQGPFERFPRLRCHFRPTSSLPPSPGFAWRTPGTFSFHVQRHAGHGLPERAAHLRELARPHRGVSRFVSRQLDTQLLRPPALGRGILASTTNSDLEFGL